MYLWNCVLILRASVFLESAHFPACWWVHDGYMCICNALVYTYMCSFIHVYNTYSCTCTYTHTYTHTHTHTVYGMHKSHYSAMHISITQTRLIQYPLQCASLFTPACCLCPFRCWLWLAIRLLMVCGSVLLSVSLCYFTDQSPATRAFVAAPIISVARESFGQILNC